MAHIEPEALFQSGRSHALSAERLFHASLDYAKAQGIENIEKFAFNGTFSLSVHYLLGLGAELMLKAAYVRCGGNADDKYLRNEIGHDLIKALDMAEAAGFKPATENLREILDNLRESYLKHFFRYGRPAEFPLPDVPCVISAYAILDEQLRDMFGWTED